MLQFFKQAFSYYRNTPSAKVTKRCRHLTLEEPRQTRICAVGLCWQVSLGWLDSQLDKRRLMWAKQEMMTLDPLYYWLRRHVGMQLLGRCCGELNSRDVPLVSPLWRGWTQDLDNNLLFLKNALQNLFLATFWKKCPYKNEIKRSCVHVRWTLRIYLLL